MIAGEPDIFSRWLDKRAEQKKQRTAQRDQHVSNTPDIECAGKRPYMDRETADRIIREARYEGGGVGNRHTTKAERRRNMNEAGSVAAALLATQFDIPKRKKSHAARVSATSADTSNIIDI